MKLLLIPLLLLSLNAKALGPIETLEHARILISLDDMKFPKKGCDSNYKEAHNLFLKGVEDSNFRERSYRKGTIKFVSSKNKLSANQLKAMETKIKNIPDAGNSLSSLKSTCYNQKEITKYYSLGKTYGKTVTSDYAYEIGIKFACKKRSEIDKKTMDCDKEVSTLMKSFSNKKEIEAFKNKVK